MSLIQPPAGHKITVTPGPFGRAWFECSCTPPINHTLPSKRAANRTALRHLHDVLGGCSCPPEVLAYEAHPDPDPSPAGRTAVA